MPDDPVTTTLDVQFGGMDLSSDSALSFSSVMQGGKQSAVENNLIYGSQTGKLDSFVPVTAGDKDIKPTGHSSSSPFQAQINSQSQASLPDPGKGASAASNITPGIETLTSLTQNQNKPQQAGPNTYGAAVNSGTGSGSAFVSYAGKGAPGFPAPGFPPVSQTAAGSYSSSVPVTGGVPPYGTQPVPNQQSGYMNLAYGSQPAANPTSQTAIASSTNVPYGLGSVPPQGGYMNSAVNSG